MSTDTPAHHDDWLIADVENEQYDAETTRAEADARLDKANDVPGVDAELFPPGESPQFMYDLQQETYGDPDTETDGCEPEVVDHDTDSHHEPEVMSPDEIEQAADDLPDRNVGDDPLKWLPGEFVDSIDGSPAINRKGFEVLGHFYSVDVDAELQVAPEDNGHEYARVKATAEIDGRTVEAFGSAHVDRGDDSFLLLEMAGTRARKRALSIATGAGAVAVEELKNQPEGRQ